MAGTYTRWHYETEAFIPLQPQEFGSENNRVNKDTKYCLTEAPNQSKDASSKGYILSNSAEGVSSTAALQFRDKRNARRKSTHGRVQKQPQECTCMPWRGRQAWTAEHKISQNYMRQLGVKQAASMAQVLKDYTFLTWDIGCSPNQTEEVLLLHGRCMAIPGEHKLTFKHLTQERLWLKPLHQRRVNNITVRCGVTSKYKHTLVKTCIPAERTKNTWPEWKSRKYRSARWKIWRITWSLHHTSHIQADRNRNRSQKVSKSIIFFYTKLNVPTCIAASVKVITQQMKLCWAKCFVLVTTT